jgi:aspartate aminotransferase
MNEYLSKRITEMQESATLQMAKVARALRAQGLDIIDLSIGEPDFDTPVHIRDAAKRAIDEGYTRYTPVPGYPELRKAIAAKLKRDNQLDYTHEQIVVSTGAKQAIANVVLSLINPGDEVLLPAPYWVSYSAIADLAEGKSIEIYAGIESGFKITPALLEQHITSRTRLIIFSSPCNPTGAVYTHAEMEALANTIAKYPSIYVISDEIYEYINYTGLPHVSLAQFAEVKEQVITVNGFSKGFAMTGWRLGYIAAPLWIAKACEKMQGQFTSGTCSIAQMAGVTAISSDLAPTHAMVKEFRRRRDMVHALLSEIPGLKINKPDGAFYFFFDVSAYFGKTYRNYKITNPESLCAYLLQEGHIGLVNGEAFGDINCIRLSYAASDEKLIAVCQRLKEALSKLS